MSYSVCIIDNDIPASGTQAQALGITDTGLLNRANLQLLLQEETCRTTSSKNWLKGC